MPQKKAKADHLKRQKQIIKDLSDGPEREELFYRNEWKYQRDLYGDRHVLDELYNKLQQRWVELSLIFIGSRQTDRDKKEYKVALRGQCSMAYEKRMLYIGLAERILTNVERRPFMVADWKMINKFGVKAMLENDRDACLQGMGLLRSWQFFFHDKCCPTVDNDYVPDESQYISPHQKELYDAPIKDAYKDIKLTKKDRDDYDS